MRWLLIVPDRLVSTVDLIRGGFLFVHYASLGVRAAIIAGTRRGEVGEVGERHHDGWNSTRADLGRDWTHPFEVG